MTHNVPGGQQIESWLRHSRALYMTVLHRVPIFFFLHLITLYRGISRFPVVDQLELIISGAAMRRWHRRLRSARGRGAGGRRVRAFRPGARRRPGLLAAGRPDSLRGVLSGGPIAPEEPFIRLHSLL